MAKAKDGTERGRPSKYSKEICDRLCDRIANSSLSLKSIVKESEDYPSHVTIMAWLNDETKKDFLNQYIRAREAKADFLAEEILAISDDGTNDYVTVVKGGTVTTVENKEWTSRSKLRVDARIWLASKLMPKKYGNKLDVTSKDEKIESFNVAEALQNFIKKDEGDN